MSGLSQDHKEVVGGINEIDQLQKLESRISTSVGLDKEMPPVSGSSIHRSASRPQLDLSGAAIQGNFEEKDPTILLPNQSDDISHLALDIGGTHFFFSFFLVFIVFSSVVNL